MSHAAASARPARGRVVAVASGKGGVGKTWFAITLAQALGRIGGLREDRADIRGVFVFRLEDPAALDPALASGVQLTEGGKVPVIYRLNLADASGFFVAQDFPVRDEDVLYVSSAPLVDLQRFIATLSGFAFSTIAIGSALGSGGTAN